MRIIPLISLSLTILLSSSFAAKVKDETIESKIIELPRINVKGIDYSGLSVEFAINKVKIGEKTKIKGQAACQPKGSKGLKNAALYDMFYYSVKYNLPALILVVKNSGGEVVYADKIQDPSTQVEYYGKDKCENIMPGALEKNYGRDQGAFIAQIKANAEKNIAEKATDIIKNALFAKYTKESFRLTYAVDDELNYSDLDNAYKLALDAYNNYSQQGYNESSINKLKEAITIWEKAIEESDLSNRKARINYKITLKLYENLAIAYMYTNDYEKSVTYFQKIRSTQKAVTSTSSESHFSQVQNRAKGRIIGINRNKDALSSKATVDKLLKDAATYRESIKISKLDNSQYASLNNVYIDYMKKTGAETQAYAENANQKAVESGDMNPYQSLIQYTATQGYAIMVTPLMNNKKFTSLPDEMCDLVQVNQILISNNQIETISSNIGNLKNLKVLTLKNNKIKEIPASIGKCINLKKLNLSNNQITSLPAEISNLKNLKSLALKGNPISSEEQKKIIQSLPECKVKF